MIKFQRRKNKIKRVNIYNHYSLKSYLHELFEFKKVINPLYSFRSMAIQLELKNHSQLFQILKGKVKFPVELINLFSKVIGKHDQNEKRYFEQLVKISHLEMAKADQKDLSEALIQLDRIKPLDIHFFEFDADFSNPLTMIVFELIGRQKVVSIDDLYQLEFMKSYRRQEISNSLESLMKSEMIQINAEKKIEQNHHYIMATNDVPSEHVRQYHKEASQLAQMAIDCFPVDLREYQSLVLNINSRKMKVAKQMLRSFLSDFAKAMEEEEKNYDQTYNINIQFFPVIR